MKTLAPNLLRSIAILAVSATSALAEDRYYVVPLGELAFDEGQDGLAEALARPASNTWSGWVGQQREGGLGVRVPESVEAYLAHPQTDDDGLRFDPQARLRLAVRTGNTDPIRGSCDLAPSREGREAFAFTLDPTKYTPATREEFDAVRTPHYRALAEARIPGSPWFRHLATKGDADAQEGDRETRARRVERELSPTFAAFSGGRAIAENLALDRELILARVEGGEMTAIADIQGITVPAIDWQPRLGNRGVEVDPLAKALPLDQHALFFRSAPALVSFIELLEDEGAPLWQNYDVRSPFKTLPTRYLAQLGLGDRKALAQLPAKSIALTGGDPFLPSGSDIALVFESADPAALYEKLSAMIEAAADKVGALPVVTIQSEGGQHRSFQTPDRSVFTHLLRNGDLVAVANSTIQLDRLLAVSAGTTPSLGTSDEFAFFRQRYSFADEDESAFLFISDATIRRWCGPRMRIGASRRARAIAALGELTARQLAGGDTGNDFEPLLGAVSKGADGHLYSGRFGSLRFTTPVSELSLDEVTSSEEAAYETWRRGYQSGWRRVFDPIAVRLSSGDNGHDIDLSIIPLTIDTRYREWIQLAGDATLSEAARRAHDEAALLLSFAVDSKSEAFMRSDKQLSDMMPGLKVNPLAWVGESVSIYFERDFFWRALEASDNEGSSFLTSNIGQLPVGMRVESNSNIKLALFLTGLRGLTEASAPGLLQWDKRLHGKQPYIAVISEGAMGTDLSFYYATVPGALLLSLSEDILKRAIDREAAGKGIKGGVLPVARHALMHADPLVFDRAGGLLNGRSLLQTQRRQSWRALPVLNEWHRRSPGADPAALHLATFGTPLSCPGGKGYRWNEDAMTMESVTFGHPAEPAGDVGATGFAANYSAMTAGLGFEDDGLRVRASVSKRDAAHAIAPVLPGGDVLATAKDILPTQLGTIRRYEFNGDDAPFQSVEFAILQPGERDGQPTVRSRAKRQIDDDTTTESVSEHAFTDSGFVLIAHDSDALDHHYSEPMVEIPAQLIEAHTQTYPFHGSSQFEGEDEALPIYGEVELTVVGVETLSVPAGTFEDCVRVEVTTQIVSGGRISKSSYTNWYGSGVGLVKSASDADAGLALELTEIKLPK